MVSCDTSDHGCNGGNLGHAWQYLESNGIPSDDCDPYVSGKGTVEKCQTKCTDGSRIRKHKCKTGSV